MPNKPTPTNPLDQKAPKPKRLTLTEQLRLSEANHDNALVEIERLRREHAAAMESLRKELAAVNELSTKRARWISDFKQERTVLERANAELMGYVQRTIEDDKVREGDRHEKADGALARPMSEMDRENAHRSIEQEYSRTNFPPPAIRRGPMAMHPQVIISGRHGGGEFDFESLHHGRTMTATAAPETHWQDRN